MSDFVVKEISSELASRLILTYHYAHRTPQIVFAFGLFESGEYVGCVSYGRPATPQVAKSVFPADTKAVYELNRLVIITKTKNAASYLVGQSLRRLKDGLVIVSYADGAFGHIGYIYQATNFYYAGAVKAHDSEYMWNGKKYHPRVLNHMGINDPVAWAKRVGAEKLPTIAKHRYVFVTGKPKERKKIIDALSWSLTMDYPKGDTKRHETEGAPKKEIIQGQLF